MIEKLKTIALAIAAVAAAILAAFAFGRRRGKTDERAATQAASDQAVRQLQETAHAVENQVAKLPDAPAQKIADANPATAAGKLRDRWLRDSPDDHP